jgi:signal peptidase II
MRAVHGYGLLWAAIVLLDRITKTWIIMYVPECLPITSFLSWDLTFNRGISWSMFHTDAQTPFLVITCAVILVTLMLGYYTYIRYTQQRLIVGEIMVLAGSTSNIIDRIWYGGVVDFIRVHYQQWSYPSFNSADAAIVIGVACMIWEYYTE